jgi:hypothetical protein
MVDGAEGSIRGPFFHSLRIYIDRNLGEQTGLFLWFEPTWHLGSAEGVLVGSRQAQVEDQADHVALDLLVQQLLGRSVEHVAIDALSYDVEVRFTGGYWIKTFVSDTTADENWYFRDCRSNDVVSSSAKGLRLGHIPPSNQDAPQAS